MHENHRGSLGDALIDAAIAGGSAAFAAWSAAGTLDPKTAFIGFGMAFFVSLVAARGRHAHGETP